MENIDKSSNSSIYTEEDELFEYILNQDENNINSFLLRQKFPIYNFKTKDGKSSNVLHISSYKKILILSKHYLIIVN